MTGNIGTVGWVAPEIFSDKKFYSEKADIYSFGMICWELLTRKIPFDDIESFSVPLLVLKGKRPLLPKDGNKVYRKLIKACWSQKPDGRPNIAKVILILGDLIRKPGKKNEVLPVPKLTETHQIQKEAGGFKLVCLSTEAITLPPGSSGNSSRDKKSNGKKI